MTRLTRTRSDLWTNSGQYRYSTLSNPGTTKTYAYSILRTCSDSHGRPVVDSAFSSYQIKGKMTVTGLLVSSYNVNTVRDTTELFACPLRLVEGANPTPLPVSGGWYLDTIAGTNPSRPVMTPLTLLQDLIELPRQIRDVGKLLNKPKSLLSPKEAANQFLGIKFGWLPLIEDLRQILDLQSYILKRSKELQQLYSGRGLRRRIKMADDTYVGSFNIDFALYGANNYGRVPVEYTLKRSQWATIHWYPTTPPPYHPSDEEMNRFCKRLVLGLTVEGMTKGLWDVIPWTWLLGWFTNVGKYSLLYSNTVPASHSSACLMNKCETEYRPKSVSLVGVEKQSYLIPAGTTTITTRSRVTSGSVTPGFNMPFMDVSRLSVLGALFVQRTVR